MGKKKICFIAQFPPPMHGLSKAVETLYNSELNSAIDSDGEFEFEKVDITNNKEFFKNLVKISKSKADLFYFTISQTKGGNLRDLVIFKLLELQRKKCLIHLHGGDYRQLVDNDMAGWQRKANYKAIKKLVGAIVLSKSLKKIFEGMIDEDKIFVVSNCVDNQYLMSNEKFRNKISTISQREIKHVLYLSNFIRTKGYSEVLEMADLEKKRVESGGKRLFHFDFAGKFFEDDEEQYFFNFIHENNLEEYITYHGIVSGKKKEDLLEKSDIFVLLTKYPNEGQPISILEAMGNGMVIVTTDHAGIPDIVTDKVHGIVINKTALNIAEVAYSEIQNIDYYNAATAGREKIVRYYSERKYIADMSSVLGGGYNLVVVNKFVGLIPSTIAA